jgi:hypothetical protein
MKKTCLLLLFFSLTTFANTLNVEQMTTVRGFDLSFKLSPSTPNGHIVLDCQSYFQKLDFYNQSSHLIFENYITIDECQELYLNTKSCLEKQGNKCFDSNNIFDESCSCSN